MENLVEFWKNKKVFLTGHTGFKGSWLSLCLQELQAHVIGYALDPPTKVNLFSEAKVAENMVDIRGDIRDFDELQKCLKEHQPEIIIHMAAQPLVGYSYLHPVDTYMTNVMGTVHLLEAARHTPSVKAVLNVTSDKCYENQESGIGYSENDPMGGHDPYSSSKGCAELATAAYRRSFFHEIGLASARAGNVIGGGDWSEDRLIPDLVQSCVARENIHIRHPHATRPWQHVLESLAGYLLLAELLYKEPARYASAWNFGPDQSDSKTVYWVASKIIELWEAEIQIQLVNQNKFHEAAELQLNSSKAFEKLGWQPIWDLNEALFKTIDWYKAYYSKKNDTHAFTLEQIHEYFSCAQPKLKF